MSQKKRLLFFLIKVVLLANALCNVTKETIVPTKVGTFIGKTEVIEFNGESKHVQHFFGIPYAKPPVGERRFLRPEPFGSMSQSYNATYHRSHCLQTVPLYYKHLEDFQRSEDCLYLNLYVPGNVTSVGNKLAVMLYIHGGSFALGGADIYSGDILASFNDVIVVTINYRLNVFGFLSNGTKSSGNFGLWDMRMALQWVHDHINSFGGDPTRVTLFGNSAGGAAVIFLATYPENKGLFQRIIAQSGSSLAYWAYQKNPADYYLKYITDVGCDLKDYEEIRKCLLSKSAAELQVGSWDFLPSIDWDFLWEAPADTFSEKSLYGDPAKNFFSEIDFMNGATSRDGAMYVPIWKVMFQAENINISEGVPRQYFEDVYIPERLVTILGSAPTVITESVIQQYMDWTQPDDALVIREKMIDLASDTAFFIPGIKATQDHITAQKNSKKSASYFYVFDHKPSFIPKPEWLEGAEHTMEVPYIFGLHGALYGKLVEDQNAVDPITVTKDEINLSKVLMTMWSNFAKSG